MIQILLSGASEYEKKSQRIDFEHLHDLGRGVNAEFKLTYGQPPESELPEAVEEAYFSGAAGSQPAGGQRSRYTIGSFLRRSIVPIVEQTLPRLHRNRDDIDWLLLEHPPAPDDFAQFDAWIDPAVDENDFDGFVAEALVRGKIVVASRTQINTKRLEKGRTGLLVPPGDANELTHAILAALFKPEVAQQKIEAARQTIAKFHPRQRLRALTQLLETALR